MSRLLNNMPQFKTVGSILKHYRESKGYTIEDISNKTYIKSKYLQALENGNNEILPPSFFVLSYIKHYAKVLEIDAEYLVNMYKEEFNIKDNNNSNNFNNFDSKINNYYNENNNMNLDELFSDNKKQDLNAEKPIIEQKPFFIKDEVKSEQFKDRDLSFNSEEIKRKANDIILEAEKKAEEIILNAQNKANTIINHANKFRIESYIYANNLFTKLETEISKILKEVKNGREFLKTKKNG